MVSFIVPVPPKHRTNWERGIKNLRRTLGCLAVQTDPRWEVRLVHSGGLPDDLPVEAILHKRHTSREANDKYQRLKTGMAATDNHGGWVVPLDWDDLVSRRIVATIHAYDGPSDMLMFDEGYVLDVRRWLFWPIKKVRGRSGTAFALRRTFRQCVRVIGVNHWKGPSLVKRKEPIQGRMAVHTVNNGTNVLYYGINKTGKKGDPVTQEFAEEFGIPLDKD